MEEDFVFLPFFFYFFTWMAVAHIHTSNTKRSFHEISRLYDNKYNTSNYYVDAYVKTHFAELQQQRSSLPRKQLHLSKHLSNNLFSLSFFSYIPFLFKLTPIYSLVCFLSPWNSKLIIFYCVPCDLIISSTTSKGQQTTVDSNCNTFKQSHP